MAEQKRSSTVSTPRTPSAAEFSRCRQNAVWNTSLGSRNATDDGQPRRRLHTLWTPVSGPGTVTFAKRVASTTAAFSARGLRLRLTADDASCRDGRCVVVFRQRRGAIRRLHHPACAPSRSRSKRTFSERELRWTTDTKIASKNSPPNYATTPVSQSTAPTRQACFVGTSRAIPAASNVDRCPD